MRCVFCSEKVVSKKVTFIHEQDGQWIIIRDVPAEVCTSCGERTYAPETTDEIMNFARQHFKPIQWINVPIFDYRHKDAILV